MGELAPVQAGRAVGSRRRQAMTATAVRGLSRFAEARGVPSGREFLLDYDVIEAFCVAGLAARACSTRGTYRSAPYRLAEAANGPRGPAGDAVRGRESAGAVRTGGAGRAGRGRRSAARSGQTLLGAGDGRVRHRRRTAAR